MPSIAEETGDDGASLMDVRSAPTNLERLSTATPHAVGSPNAGGLQRPNERVVDSHRGFAP